MINILVVDDNESIRKLIAAYLRRAGYEPHAAADGAEALAILEKTKVDLMVVDIMMPNVDGLSLTRQLREAGYAMPVLMATAREGIEDKTKGFLAGADDYMVKPIDFDEMLLRVAALLRRAKIASERRISLGGVTLDYDSLTVTREGEAATLPKKEFYLLFKLLSYPQRIFTRQDLMDDIWGMENETDARTVDVHIKRLREKFDGWPEFSIVTVRGLGYKAERNA